jgi:SNF2 family DNA or RNA helicase
MDRDKPGGFLCDEMGLGKTVQMIYVMVTNQKRRTLVIAPKSVLMQWKEEIKRFSSLMVHVWDGPKRTDDLEQLNRYDVVITSYSLLKDVTPLHKIRWNRLILDEAHEVRNSSTKVHSSIMHLQSVIRWNVTGTPVFNSIRDFVNLCKIVGIPQLLVQQDIAGVRDRYVLRRTKEDVSEFNERLKLPKCSFENVEVEMNPDEKIVYKFAFESAQNKIMECANVVDNESRLNMVFIECLLRMRQVMTFAKLYIDGVERKEGETLWTQDFVCSSKKMDLLVESVDSHKTEKTLIFCQFKGEMDEIQKRLKKYKIYRLDGSVSKELRAERITEFRECQEGAVFIIQIKAGGVGLNLQEATRVYIMSPSWNPATELQAIGRCHRTGQTRNVYVKKLIYVSDNPPSVEESIVKVQNQKALVCEEILNDNSVEVQIPGTANTKGPSVKFIKDFFTV